MFKYNKVSIKSHTVLVFSMSATLITYSTSTLIVATVVIIVAEL